MTRRDARLARQERLCIWVCWLALALIVALAVLGVEQ